MTYYGNVGFPAGVSFKVIQEYFCGNTHEDAALFEQCDYGPTNSPNRSCCTPSCHWGKGGRPCGPRKTKCYKKARCAAVGFCRGTRPKKFGKPCKTETNEKGYCDGKGVCKEGTVKGGKFYGFLDDTRRRSKRIKDFLRKRNLKIRQKHKDFNLDEIETQTKSNNKRDFSSDKKLKRHQEIVDEIFDEDEISDEENAADEDTDDEDQEDLDHQEFDDEE